MIYIHFSHFLPPFLFRIAASVNKRTEWRKYTSFPGFVAYGSLTLLELGPAAAHDLSLADQFSVELTAIEREINVKVHTIESTLRGIHALKVRFEVLPRKVRCERNDFLDACR